MITSGESCDNTQVEIFLVEDNRCDIVLFKQILRRSSVACSLTAVSDGSLAIERLKEGVRPDVIFLDLNLPGKTGKEILAELKQDAAFAAIPVAVLTGSDDDQDREICNFLGADNYFSKAAALTDFFDLASQVTAFLQTLQRGRGIAGIPDYPAISAA